MEEPDKIVVLAERLIESNARSTEKIIAASQEDANQALAQTRTIAQRATATTTAAAERIRRLNLITVLLSATMLIGAVVFAVLFWKYAIVVRLPAG